MSSATGSSAVTDFPAARAIADEVCAAVPPGRLAELITLAAPR
jgi:hypothetical protein